MELLPLVCLCLLSCSGDAVKVFVKEGSDAVLPCLISTEDLKGKLFDWRKVESQKKKEVFLYNAGNHYNNGLQGQDEQFKGRVSHFQDQLKNGDASIKITKTKMADNGNYSCDFPRLQPSQTFDIELVVGAAPKPFVKVLDQTKDWSLLQCEVVGASPKPKVEWKDSSGNILPADVPLVIEREGRFYFILKTTVTRTDHYSCVVTQEDIGHQTDAETYVHINGAVSKPYVKTIQTDDGMMLLCEVLGVSPKPKVEWKDSSGNVLPVKDLKEIERGGSYDIILQAALTKTDNFSCVVTQEGSYSPLSAEIYAVTGEAPEPGSNTGWIITVVVLILLLVIAIAFAVAVVLYHTNRNKPSKQTNCVEDPGSTPVAANGQKEANEGTKMIESE